MFLVNGWCCPQPSRAQQSPPDSSHQVEHKRRNPWKTQHSLCFLGPTCTREGTSVREIYSQPLIIKTLPEGGEKKKQKKKAHSLQRTPAWLRGEKVASMLWSFHWENNMKRKEKTRLKRWAFVESIMRSVYWLRQTRVPAWEAEGWFWTTLPFPSEGAGLWLSSPLDLCWVQALEINWDFFLKAWVCFPLVSTVWFFSTLEEKALQQADEKAFCTSASSQQHWGELSANKSGFDELQLPFKIQSWTDLGWWGQCIAKASLQIQNSEWQSASSEHGYHFSTGVCGLHPLQVNRQILMNVWS